MKSWLILVALLFSCCSPGFSQTVTRLSLDASHMVYDPVSAKIYATIPSSATSHSNAVVVVDPTSGNVDAYIPVSGDPDRIAVSNNGQYLYVVQDSAGAIQRINIATLTPDLQFSFVGSAAGTYRASDIVVLPGQPHSVAVVIGFLSENLNAYSQIAVFDDGVARPLEISSTSDNYYALAVSESASTLYAQDQQVSGETLTALNVSSDGAQVGAQVPGMLPGISLRFDQPSGLLYSGSLVADPATDMLKGEFGSAVVDDSCADDANHRAFTLSVGTLPPSAAPVDNIREFSSNTYLPLGSFTVPEIEGGTDPRDLTVVGKSGLAFLSVAGDLVLISNRSLPELASFTLSTDLLMNGRPVTAKLRLTQPAPPGGLTVLLESSNVDTEFFDVPSSITFPAGASSESFAITTTYPYGVIKSIISAKYGVQTLGRPLYLVQSPSQPLYPANMQVEEIEHNDLIYNPGDGLLFASVPSTSASDPNCLVAMSPFSKAQYSLGFIGSEPDKLALSEDGTSLYVGLDGSGTVGRYDFTTGSAGPQFSLGFDGTFGRRTAADMAALAGQTDLLAVSEQYPNVLGGGQVQAFEDGAPLPGTIDGVTAIAANASASGLLYGTADSPAFVQMSVTGSGLNEISDTTGVISDFGYPGSIEWNAGRVYLASGEVVDPESASLLGTFPNISYGALVVPDTANGYAYYVTPIGFNSGPYYLNIYDTNTFAELASYYLPNLVGQPEQLIETSVNHLVIGTNAGEVAFVDTTPARLASLNLPAQILIGGRSETATLSLSNVAPLGGVTVSLSGSDPAVSVPATVIVPPGSNSATFSVSAAAVTFTSAAIIQASYNGTTFRSRLLVLR